MGGEGRHPSADSTLGNGEVVDLLCGGFPCQDVSVAGKRAGLEGNRSGLFWEFVRVARSVRPTTILLENVPGLLSSNTGRDFRTVVGALVELGYGVAWRVLNSRFFGVPQRRRRVFVLGVLTDGDTRIASERAAEILSVGSRCERHPAKGQEKGPETSVASLSGLGSGGPDDNDGKNGRLVTAITTRSGNTQDDQQTTQLVAYSVTPESGQGTDLRVCRVDTSPALGAAALQKDADRGVKVASASSVRRLTPTECERLQGFPDGWTAFGADSRRYAALGDAVTVNVAEWIGRRIMG